MGHRRLLAFLTSRSSHPGHQGVGRVPEPRPHQHLGYRHLSEGPQRRLSRAPPLALDDAAPASGQSDPAWRAEEPFRDYLYLAWAALVVALSTVPCLAGASLELDGKRMAQAAPAGI